MMEHHQEYYLCIERARSVMYGRASTKRAYLEKQESHFVRFTLFLCTLASFSLLILEVKKFSNPHVDQITFATKLHVDKAEVLQTFTKHVVHHYGRFLEPATHRRSRAPINY